MAILLPLLVAAIPLLITPGLLFHYDSLPKVALLVLAMSLALLRPGRLAADLQELWRCSAGRFLCMLCAAQVAWCGISAAASSRVLFSLLGSNWRRFGLLTIMALVAFVILSTAWLRRNPLKIRNVLRAMAIAALGVSLYTFAQYFSIDPVHGAAGYHAQDGDFTIVRPPATLGHADYLGWWLAINIFCSWGMARLERGAWRRVAWAATGLSAAATVLTGTRSALVAVACGLIYRAVTAKALPRLKQVLSAAAILIVSFAFYVSPAGEGLRARVHWMGDETAAGGRPLLWRDALKMATVHPLLGFGPETFAAEFPRYQSETLARLLPGFYHESPHNAALDALVDEGVPGLILAVGWVALGFLAIARARRNAAPLDHALAAAFIASCAASFFNVLTIGPAVATASLLAMLTARAGPAPAATPLVSAKWTAGLGLPAAALLAGFAVLLLVSDFRLERFSQIGSSGDPEKAVAAYRAIQISEGPAEDLYCSRRLAAVCAGGSNPIARLQCSQVATQAAARATLTADNPPNAWYNLAMFAAAHNDARGTESALRSATEVAPKWFRPHWALARFLELSGRSSEARTEIQRAAFLGAGKQPEVSDTLRSIAQAR